MAGRRPGRRLASVSSGSYGICYMEFKLTKAVHSIVNRDKWINPVYECLDPQAPELRYQDASSFTNIRWTMEEVRYQLTVLPSEGMKIRAEEL